jgi:hypothetical protein
MSKGRGKPTGACAYRNLAHRIFQESVEAIVCCRSLRPRRLNLDAWNIDRPTRVDHLSRDPEVLVGECSVRETYPGLAVRVFFFAGSQFRGVRNGQIDRRSAFWCV